MIVVKTFVSELHKKIDFLQIQIKQFEDKVNKVNDIINILKKQTLKDVLYINGDDLALISLEDFGKIIEVVNYNNPEECLKNFEYYSGISKNFTELILEGKVDQNLELKKDEAQHWLDEQANHIKEFVLEFKESNESYLDSLKMADDLYQKYLKYFKDDELIIPLTNLEEFNDVLKKSGLIMSEKWQLLKYIAQRNLVLLGKKNHDNG